MIFTHFWSSQSQWSFEDMLEHAKKKDETALGMIFDSYFDMIFGFVYKRTSDRQLTEDLVSQIWEKIYLSLGTVKEQDEAYFKNWLMKISKNTLIDYFRKKKQEYTELDEGMEKASQETPFQILLQMEETQVIEQILLGLPEKQSLCINMKYLEGMKNKEIAERLNIGETTVASNLKRGLQKMRGELEKGYMQ